MIEIRDDDVLLDSRGYSSSFDRFKQIHEWTVDASDIIHVPTILVRDIQKYPDCIDYVKDETAAKRMRPEIHGLDHIDYKVYSKEQVVDDLNRCKDFILSTFDYLPKQWMTPWGANAPHLYEAAKECNVELIDCSNTIRLEGVFGVLNKLKNGANITDFYGSQIFLHWWSRGRRLERLCSVSRYGSWEEAVKADPKLFR